MTSETVKVFFYTAQRRLALGLFRGLIDDTRAMAAIEYALISPIMVLIMAVAVLGGQAFNLNKKVVLTSGTITDLLTQYSVLPCKATLANGTTATVTLANVLQIAASTMAAPSFNPANLSLVVSEVQTDSNGNGTVTWSNAAYSGTPLTVGSSFNLNRLLKMPSVTYIVGTVSYVYTPLNIVRQLPPVTLSNTSYLMPRASTVLTLTTQAPQACAA